MTTPPPAWLLDGSCREDPDLWFPDTVQPHSPLWDEPKRVCREECPVLEKCQAWALTSPDPTRGEGVWGGLTPSERAELRPKEMPAMLPTEHGSQHGARAHHRRGEPACRSCKAAQNRTRQEYPA